MIFSVELDTVREDLLSAPSVYSVCTGSVERVVVTVVRELDLDGLASSIVSSRVSETLYLDSGTKVLVDSRGRGMGLGELLLCSGVLGRSGCGSRVVTVTRLFPEANLLLLILGS